MEDSFIYKTLNSSSGLIEKIVKYIKTSVALDKTYWEETSISALNSKLKLFPDFARKLTLTNGNWTASEDCWYNYLCMDSKEPYSLKIDNVVVSTSDKSGGIYVSYACGFAKKGSVFTNEYLGLLCKAYPLK